MDEQTGRLEQVERQVQQLRRTVNVLAVGLIALLGAFTVGAATEPQELTLRKLTIVDAKGKARITAATTPDGEASIVHYDRDGKKRIIAATHSDLYAGVDHYGRNGKRRITAATTPEGGAAIYLADRDGKHRIAAATLADGNATIAVADHTGNTTWVEGSE